VSWVWLVLLVTLTRYLLLLKLFFELHVLELCSVDSGRTTSGEHSSDEYREFIPHGVDIEKPAPEHMSISPSPFSAVPGQLLYLEDSEQLTLELLVLARVHIG